MLFVDYYPTMKKISSETIIHHLEEIWLHHTDAEVYLASIRLGACTINQLTTQTKINRITVHDSVGRLIEKWLLLETYSGKRRLVFPQQISNLQHLVDAKKTELDQLQNRVSQTITLLQSLHLQSNYLPQIRIAKGRQGISDMIQDLKISTSSDIMIMTDSRHFDELLTIHFLDSMKQSKKQIQMILPPWFEHFIFSAHAKGVNITTHTIPETMKREGGMTIRWSTVALHAYEGVYITTTIIENSAIAQMMTHCFEQMRKGCI